MIVETGLGAFLEWLVARGLQGAPDLLCLAIFERVLAIFDLLPGEAPPFSRFLQRKSVQGAETQHPFFAIALVSENPGSVPGARHLKIETVSVAIAAGLS